MRLGAYAKCLFQVVAPSSGILLCENGFREKQLVSRSTSNVWRATELIPLCACTRLPPKTAKRCTNFLNLILASIPCVNIKWETLSSHLLLAVAICEVLEPRFDC